MNLTAFAGLVAAAAVLYFGVFAHTIRPEIFFDAHALILVLGGTCASALIAFPLRQYRDLTKFFLLGLMFPAKSGSAKLIAQILMLSIKPEPSDIDPKIWSGFHPFLAEGYMLLRKNEFSTAEFKMIMQGRRQRAFDRNAWDAKALTAVAKFPPAFGLLGASTGMIAMMSNLGGAGKDVIGPSMAIALVATFWGIALANLVLLPLADRANRMNGEDARQRAMITSGLMLIQQGTRPEALYEYLIGFLPVSERNDPSFKKALFFAQNRHKLKAVS